MKVILANMGFILQMTGVFMLIPIAAAFADQADPQIITLLLTALAFFALGFFLNAMCERKELTFRQSNGLIILSFVGLSVIGSLPYFMTVFTDGSIFARLTDSLFESVSGFTTAGFSVIPDVSALPSSIHLYRSLTQFIGGIGIVLLLLMLFYPEEKLRSLAKSLGLDANERIKKTFAIIVLVYLIAGLLLIGGAALSGAAPGLSAFSYMFASLSSGGFAPVSDPSEALASSLGWWAIIAMLVAATNFFVITSLLRLRLHRVINSELPLFLLILVLASIIGHFVSGVGWYDTLFQVVSAASTTGFATMDLSLIPVSFHWLLVTLMFIGGMTISTAGGIRILRLLVAIKTVGFTTKKILTDRPKPFMLFGREYKLVEVLYLVLTILLTMVIIGAASILVSASGFSLEHSIFEVVSAVTCTGLSVGIIGAAAGMGLKWLFILLMIVGRVEIFTLLFAFTRDDKQDGAHHILATHTQPIVTRPVRRG